MNHPQPHDLTALAYGMVGGEERDKLLEHVHQCDDCRAVYDSYMEEQALVRDSLFRDARSGPAEARALERALQAINAEPQPAPVRGVGRVFRLVTWQFVGKAAAVIVVALGLLVMLTPRPDPFEPVTIAQDRQAPARVVSGSALVPAGTQWRPASAIPSHEWVAATGDEPLTLEISTGAWLEAEPGTVFRFVETTAWDVPAVCVLQGKGRLIANSSGYGATLVSGDGEFVPLPGSEVSYYARYAESPQWRAEAASMRAYAMPRTLKVRQHAGTGVYVPSMAGQMPRVVNDGQQLECAPHTSPGHDAIVHVMARGVDGGLYVTQAEMQFRELAELAVRADVGPRMQEVLRARVASVQWGGEAATLRLFSPAAAQGERLARSLHEIQLKLERDRYAELGDSNLRLVIQRGTDAPGLTATVVRGLDQTTPITARTLQELARLLPVDAAELLTPAPAPQPPRGPATGSAAAKPTRR